MLRTSINIENTSIEYFFFFHIFCARSLRTAVLRAANVKGSGTPVRLTGMALGRVPGKNALESLSYHAMQPLNPEPANALFVMERKETEVKIRRESVTHSSHGTVRHPRLRAARRDHNSIEVNNHWPGRVWSKNGLLFHGNVSSHPHSCLELVGSMTQSRKKT